TLRRRFVGSWRKRDSPQSELQCERLQVGAASSWTQCNCFCRGRGASWSLLPIAHPPTPPGASTRVDQCPLLAHSGHLYLHRKCALSGVLRTLGASLVNYANKIGHFLNCLLARKWRAGKHMGSNRVIRLSGTSAYHRVVYSPDAARSASATLARI